MTQESKPELSPQDISSLREALYWSKESYIQKARKYAFGEKMGDGYHQKIDGYYENDYLPKLKWFDEIDTKLKRLKMNDVFTVTKEWRFEDDHDRDTDETIGIFTTENSAQALIDKLVKDYSDEEYWDKERKQFYITRWTPDKPSLSSWTG